jgi:cathepsin F
LADSVDWRTKGAVNPVQNQGMCGSCWAFSSTAAIEGAHFLKTGQLLKLSEQQFVDCDKQSSGCNGGLEIWAFQYAKSNPLELETDYPYKA